MALTYIGDEGIFTLLGKLFYASEVLNTARLTTIPTAVESALEQFKLISGGDVTLQDAIDNIASGTINWQGNAGSLNRELRESAQNLLMGFITADSDSSPATLTDCLTYLIESMVADGYYVEGNTVSTSVTAGSNQGDLEVLYTYLGKVGETLENVLAEDIDVEVTTGGTTPILKFSGERKVSDKLAQDWPGGSGIAYSLSGITPAASLVSNGNFETCTIADTPDYWSIAVGRPGTTIIRTAPAQQTVTISGTPTAGSYILKWTDGNGVTRATVPLSYDSTASTVQSALRSISGLGSVTVTATGTSPDYTHTIVFYGVGGDPATIEVVNLTTGGTIIVAETVAGNVGSYDGLSLGLVSDGSELTDIYQAVSLLSDTVYFVSFRALRTVEYDESSSSPSSLSSGGSSESSTSSTSSSSSTSTSSSPSSSLSSSLTSSSFSSSSTSSTSSSSSQYGAEARVEVVEGVGGSPIRDATGNEASLRIDLESLSTLAHQAFQFSFRIPSSVTQPVYLRIRITAPMPAGNTLYVDSVILTQAVALYAGGPYVAAAVGATPSIVGDSWTMTVANNRAGEFQEWFNRYFDMASKGLSLPVSGDTLINDNLIA